METRPAFREALGFWLRLGCISFGGTAAHIAIMHDELVVKKRWIRNDLFLHALSLCMMLPGPEATQLAIYIGWTLHGRKGGVAAGTLFVLPSLLLLLLLSMVYVLLGQLGPVGAIFMGLKPAVVALVAAALLKLARRSMTSKAQWIAAAAAFAGMFFLHISVPVILVIALGIGLLWPVVQAAMGHRTESTESEDARRSRGVLRKAMGQGASVTLWFLAIWLAPTVLLLFFSGDMSFWRSLAMFFTKTAFVTVGGSYTVLPYVASVSVDHFHWLSRVQMADGFALAETTPGPLIIVVAFVGFMAAYNHFHSLWWGALGLLMTTFYTFLPCFLFVFAGAPLVEHSHGNKTIQRGLTIVTAVVVAAMFDLLFFLGRASLWHAGGAGWSGIDGLSVAWCVVSFLLLLKFDLGAVRLVALSILFGLARHWLGH